MIGSKGTTNTDGDDTVSGYVNYNNAATASAVSTYTAADNINAGLGTNVLSLTVDGVLNNAGAAVSLPAANVSNIQVLSLRNTATSNAAGDVLTVDASTMSGLTKVVSDKSTQRIDFTKLATGATVGVAGNSSVVNGAVNFSYATPANAVKIDIAGGTKAGAATDVTNTGNGATDATITSTGSANELDILTLSNSASIKNITINATTDLSLGKGTAGVQTAIANAALDAGGAKLTVTGSGVVDIEAMAANLATVDASANTGGLKAEMSAATQQVTGSTTGNDTITTGAVLTTGFAAAGGGTADRLVVSNTTHIATADLAGKYTGFEVLRNGTAASLNAQSVAGITTLETSGSGAGYSNMTAAQAAQVKVLATNASPTFILADSTGTTDVLGLLLQNEKAADAATAIDVTGLTVNGFETLNVVASSGTQGALTAAAIGDDLTFTAADKLTKVNISGAYDLDMDGANITKAVTVDATNTGTFSFTGAVAAGSVINGNNVKDLFLLSTGANAGATYNGGTGNDEFSATVAQLVADGTADNILSGGGGTDQLTITGGVTVTDNHFVNVTGMEKLVLDGTTAVSVTGLSAGFKAAYANGVTVTSGTLADGATYTWTSGLYDKAVNLTLASSGDGASVADNIAITTGSGGDNISVTASSWVGQVGATGTLQVATGSGNDTITVAHGTLVASTTANQILVNGGAGQDSIYLSGDNAGAGAGGFDVVKIVAGESTTTAYDSVSGFDLGTGTKLSSGIDFDSAGLTAYALTSDTGVAGLSLSVSGVTGVVTFSGANSASATLDQRIAAVQHVVTANEGDSAVFTYAGNTYVFNNDSDGDSVVQLTGVAATSLITANATTAGAVYIF